MAKKKTRFKKSFTSSELDLMYEALSLYVSGGAHMAVGFFRSDNDEMYDKSSFTGEEDLIRFLESGDGYLRPFASKQPEHQLTPKEKAQIMMILGHIAEVQEELELVGDRDVPTEAEAEQMAKENINGVVAGFYKLLKGDE